MTAKKRRTILSIVAAVEILVLAALGIYAWIEGSISPQLAATNVKIVNSPGITMLLNGDTTQIIDINEFLADYGASFNLAEASSRNGTLIYIRDERLNPTDDDEKIFIREADSYDQGISYISFNFTMKPEFDSDEGEGIVRKVWLDPEYCYIGKVIGGYDENNKPISYDPIIPIRISLTFHIDNGAEQTYIFGEDRLPGEPDNGRTYPAIGYYTTSEAGHWQNQAIFDENVVQNVHSFSDFAPSSQNALFSLSEGETAYMTVRIWLEGADPLCTDDIAGGTFDLSLYFTTNG